jgi:hypothetical protein
MKLSEAIRLGATLKPQAFDGLDHHGGSCALRAAAEALGLPTDGIYINYNLLRELYPYLGKAGQPCPVCATKIGLPSDVIGHLNDKHRWTRERIADFVETIEVATPAEPIVEAEVQHV